MSSYPDNWAEIATEIKRSSGYHCDRCGLKCLPPARSYRHLELSLRRKLSAQVHHIDGNPSHNDKSNLVCLCSGCHLRMHRHRPQPTPGQLSLKLKLPKVRRSRQKLINFQLTLTDLIFRLPQLPLILHQQLELDLIIASKNNDRSVKNKMIHKFLVGTDEDNRLVDRDAFMMMHPAREPDCDLKEGDVIELEEGFFVLNDDLNPMYLVTEEQIEQARNSP